MKIEMEIVDRLIELRDFAKWIFGKDYNLKVEKFMQILRAVMTKKKIGAIESTLELSKIKEFQSDGNMLLLTCACLELIEIEP